jgi:hypothetical protein
MKLTNLCRFAKRRRLDMTSSSLASATHAFLQEATLAYQETAPQSSNQRQRWGFQVHSAKSWRHELPLVQAIRQFGLGIEHGGADSWLILAVSKSLCGFDSTADTLIQTLSERLNCISLSRAAGRKETPTVLYGQCSSPDFFPQIYRKQSCGAPTQQRRKSCISASCLQTVLLVTLSMATTGFSHEHTPATMEKGHNVLCMLFSYPCSAHC